MQHKRDGIAAGRRGLLLIVAVFVVPLLVALAWYLFAPRLAPTSPANGALIEPARPLEPFEVARASGGAYRLDDLHGHWTLIHVLGDDCGDRCSQRLYASRQIHDALGEDRIRVRRIALAADGRGTPGLADILAEHPRLTVLAQGPEGALAQQLPPAAGATVYLVDPLGNLMMRFGPAVEPGGILDDLERLLKLSRIG